MSTNSMAVGGFYLLEDTTGRPSQRLHDASLLIEVASDALGLGAEVHYLGSAGRLDDVRAVLQMGARALRMQDWRMPPLERIGRRCREAFPREVLEEQRLLLEALGFVCLPVPLSERILHRPASRPLLLLIDGVEARNPDVALALSGISAYCKRSGTTLAIFP